MQFDAVRITGGKLTMFINWHTQLPMGTIEEYKKDSNNQLYTYYGDDPNVSTPPTETVNCCYP